MLWSRLIMYFSLTSFCCGFIPNITTGLSVFHISAPDYDYWCVGSCDKDGSSNPEAGLILSGGGGLVSDAVKQHIAMAGKGADFLILRTSGNDSDNQLVWDLGSDFLNSCATLLLKNTSAASNAFVLKKVEHAEAIWFAGGHQRLYITEWTGSPLQVALTALVDKNVPIGGTSAGCAILGDFVYSALHASLHSDKALADPYNTLVTLDHQFLPFQWMKHFITDPHFVTRDRMGRSAVFLARLIEDGWDTAPYGIGIDEKTAVVIGSDGRATTYGASTAYVIHGTKATSSDFVCKNKTSLSFSNITVQKLSGLSHDSFDFNTLEGGKVYSFDIEEGKIQGNPY